MLEFIKIKNQGAIALIMVIMITALTLLAAVSISLINISDSQADYQISERAMVEAKLAACLDEALLRLSSDYAEAGYFSLAGIGIDCDYEIATEIMSGLKEVLLSASSTSSLGFWQSSVIATINVSSTPISVYSYKNDQSAYASASSAGYCGDGVWDEQTEECDGSADPSGLSGWSCSLGGALSCNESCEMACTAGVPYEGSCGDSTVQAPEVCDPPQNAGSCGDGIVQNGNFCNSTCSGYVTRNETCDYTGSDAGNQCYTFPVGCNRETYCQGCTICTNLCL
ncbi:MAG: hypothetical protein PHO91_00050 [Patescibacteria group bacterium]|nr:hypothetical protein [Patescibacteria group bacterium]